VVDLSASPAVYALAMVPALLWGFSPVLSKRGMAEGGRPMQASLVVVGVDSALYLGALGALGAITGRPAFAGLTPATLGVFLVAGLVGTALGRLATFAGVQRVGASVNSAAISARPLFATAFAVAFLGEAATAVTVAGVVTLAVGLGVLAVARGGDIEGWEPRHLLYPVAGAACFAVGNVLRRFGLSSTPITPLEAVTLNEVAALVGLGAFVLASGRRDLLRAPRRSYAYFAASGVLTAVALLSLFSALALPSGRVVVVDPLAATAPLFTALFAALLLGDLERVTRGVVAGAALIVVGGALVTVA
jgi:uncharacterized membrane protein